MSGDSDLEAVWKDSTLLLKRAAPGTLFAFFGLVMIGTALWRGPVMLQAYFVQERASSEALYSLIDRRAQDVLAVLRQYMAQDDSQAPAPKSIAVSTTSPAGK